MKSPIQSWIALDCETGGLPGKEKKAFDNVALTEVALVLFNSNLEIVDQASWLIKPYKDDLIYDPRAAEVSGITKQMVIDEGMDIKDVVKQMITFFKKNKVDGKLPTLCGHCITTFDAEFIINAFAFCGEELTKYVHDEIEDTIRWSRIMWPESINYKLGTCCDNAGIVNPLAHRALPDTLVTAKLMIHFLKNLRGLNSNNGQKVEETRHRSSFSL